VDIGLATAGEHGGY